MYYTAYLMWMLLHVHRAHIPGAVYMNPLHNTTSSFMYPRPMPTPEVMEPYIRSIGINQASHVIVYDNNGQCGFFISGRAWWMLKVTPHMKCHDVMKVKISNKLQTKNNNFIKVLSAECFLIMS